ncbi:MAG TPA: hypothetical protein VJP85_11585 [Candidatus Baltobacteraceae bacterium]|nr:hypothetical protein [Candidatus Baltobacteraceae bacterium]
MSRKLMAAAVCGAVVALAAPQGAFARAHLVAVFPLRSTAALKAKAASIARQLAARISAQDGFEARVISLKGSAADAAAGIGAEDYVTGEIVSDGGTLHVDLVDRRVSDESRAGSLRFNTDNSALPQSVNVASLFGEASAAAAAASPAAAATIEIPSGEQISVAILQDIGSRISQEGDNFAVQTTEDFYYQGKLILPKGSPGYGKITHLKRAGHWHAGGELNFTVSRLIDPQGRDIAVSTTGPTADANKDTEHNGNEVGQYLLFGGIGLFSHRGNDMLIKKGAQFHVYTVDTPNVPVVSPGATPVPVDDNLVTTHE